MKRGVVLIISILLIIVNSILVSATIDVTYNFKDSTGDITNVDYVFYKCTDTCSPSELQSITSDSGNSGSNSYYLKQYPLEGTYAYFFYKECNYPFSERSGISTLSDKTSKIRTFSQKSSCSSPITSISISGSNKVNEPLTISAGIKSAFEKGTSPPTNFIPSTKENYYTSTAKVTLIVDNQEIETKLEDILISTTKQVSFTWTPTQAKSYEIKIKTNVDDCQCSQSDLEFSNPQTITISQPTSYQCSDGTDNDGDGLIDYPSDPGCASSTDDNEYNAPTTNPCTITDWECNDWSICTDSEQTRTCTKTTCDGETGKPLTTQSCTQCSDNYDNDNDNKIDLNDPGCSSTTDNDETDLEA